MIFYKFYLFYFLSSPIYCVTSHSVSFVRRSLYPHGLFFTALKLQSCHHGNLSVLVRDVSSEGCFHKHHCMGSLYCKGSISYIFQ